MTQTIDSAVTPEVKLTAVTPQERVDAWLADFESALAARDIERVAGKFALDSFWRDLVSFTWNIKTVEGREQIADMLSERLDDTDPSGFRTTETPDEATASRRPGSNSRLQPVARTAPSFEGR